MCASELPDTHKETSGPPCTEATPRIGRPPSLPRLPQRSLAESLHRDGVELSAVILDLRERRRASSRLPYELQHPPDMVEARWRPSESVQTDPPSQPTPSPPHPLTPSPHTPSPTPHHPDTHFTHSQSHSRIPCPFEDEESCVPRHGVAAAHCRFRRDVPCAQTNSTMFGQRTAPAFIDPAIH
eukprot:GHVU01124279.1.p1 GENE.GHVU01124279.1~~GHVU01124279.1.p1  ORF type:complete len:183 (-),score=6.93 GHVU01124279.1:281-829(-)